MATDAYGVAKQCPTCAQSRIALRKLTKPRLLSRASEPLTEVNMDIIGPLLKSKKPVRHHSQEPLSKVVGAVAFRKIDAISVASAFIEMWD